MTSSSHMAQPRRRSIVATALLCVTAALHAQEPAHTVDQPETVVGPDTTSSPDTARGGQPVWNHPGLLRARDMTPFGILRLDMLPAHTADALESPWTFELQMGYQNTFVLSDNVRDYLERRNAGRIPLRTQDAAAIMALPGDSYYVDGEIGLYDLIVQRKLTPYWSTYLTVSYLHYGAGVLDSSIESFHSAFGLGQQGRNLAARNQFQIVANLAGHRYTTLDRQTDGGFADPVLGIRYSFPEPRLGWDVVAELAAKLAVGGERELLSSGHNDYGVQVTLQRTLGGTGRHAVYLGGSAVYYASGPEVPGDRSQIIPTLLAGYSFGVTANTSVILQGYASRSVIQDTSLRQLKADKYLVSFGVQSRAKHFLWSFGLTENIQNQDNTPDIGIQLGLTYLPSK